MHSKQWYWSPPDCAYSPSSAVRLFYTLKRMSLLESVAHTLLFEFRALRGGQTFDSDHRHLNDFDRACSVDGSFYALKDTVFLGSFSPKLSPLVIRSRVARVLLELISCGLWTLEGFGVQSMTTLSPSLLPSLTWLRSRPVTRASADTVSADMSVDSLEEGDSIASSPLGALRATRGSVTSDELEFLPPLLLPCLLSSVTLTPRRMRRLLRC